jgi:hypothetical protein
MNACLMPVLSFRLFAYAYSPWIYNNFAPACRFFIFWMYYALKSLKSVNITLNVKNKAFAGISDIPGRYSPASGFLQEPADREPANNEQR